MLMKEHVHDVTKAEMFLEHIDDVHVNHACASERFMSSCSPLDSETVIAAVPTPPSFTSSSSSTPD